MKYYVRNNAGQEVAVSLNNHTDLMPKDAIAVANVAYGCASHCDVSARVHGEFKQYRVTGVGKSRRARKVK